MTKRPKPHGGGTGVVRSPSIAMSVALEIVAELRAKEVQAIKKHAFGGPSSSAASPSERPPRTGG